MSDLTPNPKKQFERIHEEIGYIRGALKMLIQTLDGIEDRCENMIENLKEKS